MTDNNNNTKNNNTFNSNLDAGTTKDSLIHLHITNNNGSHNNKNNNSNNNNNTLISATNSSTTSRHNSHRFSSLHTSPYLDEISNTVSMASLNVRGINT